MYIYVVSPILEVSPFGELSYFSKYSFEKGDIIEINFNNKKINAAVVEKKDLLRSTDKSDIRKATFQLKKIENENIFGKIKKDIFGKIEKFAEENIASFGEVFYHINDIHFNLKSVKQNTQEKLCIYPDELSFKLAKKNKEKNEAGNIYKISDFIKNIYKYNLENCEIYLHGFSFVNYSSHQKPFINYFKLLILILEIENISCKVYLLNNFFGVCERYFIDNFKKEQDQRENLRSKFSLEQLQTNKEKEVKKFLIKDKINTEKAVDKNKVFSDKFLEEIEKSVKKNEKSFIFVLSHGYADRMYCESCNFSVKCPKCKKEISLLQEDEDRFLKCKSCDYKEILNISKNLRCENCGSYDLKDFGVGVQKVYEFLAKGEFKEKIKKIDESDKKLTETKIIKDVESFNGNILVGSMKVLKAIEDIFDNIFVLSLGPLPKSNNFFFDEKVLEILSLAESKTKKIFIQQNSEDEAVWDRYKNIEKYYEEEIEVRKISKLPPFSNILNISLDYKNKKILENFSFSNEIENIYYKNRRIHFYIILTPNINLKVITQELQKNKLFLDWKISNVIEIVNFWKK
jgi:primosomal protein N'